MKRRGVMAAPGDGSGLSRTPRVMADDVID
jgi:hypothetical protein